MNEEFYNYIYLDPRKPGHYQYKNLDFCFLYEPIYIGKGKNKRYLDHLKPSSLSKSSHKNNLFKSIMLNHNLKDYIIIINYTKDEECAYNNELFLCTNIGLYKCNNGPLTNQSLGGIGGVGRVMPEEEKKQRSDNHHMKNRNYEDIYGKEKSDNIKKQRSESLKGHSCYNNSKRSLKISKARINKKCVIDILSMEEIIVTIEEYNKNKFLFNKKGRNKNEIHYYSINNGEYYIKEIKEIVNIVGCSRSKVEVMLSKGVSHNGYTITTIKDRFSILKLI